MMLLILLVVCLLSFGAFSLDNGLARTPPMGWSSSVRFACDKTICNDDYSNCVSERLVKDMADRLVVDGYRDVGYEYLIIDYCWVQQGRENGKLVADMNRFPKGIKALANYLHTKGLKLGISADVGTVTCDNYPGSYPHFDEDAAVFADWGVDLLKVDGCKMTTMASDKEMDERFQLFSNAVTKTGRPILLSCKWPAYHISKADNNRPNYTMIASYCNTWRNYDDVNYSWKQVLEIVDFFARNQDDYVPAARPGQFNDPDVLIGGNFGLSYEEEKAQFMLWSMMASPLIMSNDLRTIPKRTRDLLKNKEIISVNQDPLGIMGKIVSKNGSIEIWTKPISPVSDNGKYSYAIVFFSRNVWGGPTKVSTTLGAIGLDSPDCYIVYDVLNINSKSKLCLNDTLTVSVNPSGATMIIAKSYKKFGWRKN